ncbi:MAG: signal peptidase I [Hyphomonadaceae bacterium]
MSSDSSGETSSHEADSEAPASFLDKVLHEVRETLITIAVFIPFWLVFSTFVYELRSIPSESMVPALEVGDRVAVTKFAYGYNRNSIPFGIGHLFSKENPNKPDDGIWVRYPKRGDVVVFQHPHADKVMIKRVIGLPGDKIQMVNGRLHINGEEIAREEIGTVTYVQHGYGGVVTAIEYREQLPGEDKPHIIHEFDDHRRLDRTPIFTVPPGHLFMMGDNRDNSEDSRACQAYPGLVEIAGDAWGGCSPDSEMSIGYVPVDHLIGRAETVLFTLHRCKQEPGTECLKSHIWKPL